MVSACWLIPAIGQIFIWANKLFGTEFTSKSKILQSVFGVTLVLAGTFQIFFAFLLFYSMVTIYVILRKNGLQDKVNKRMINADAKLKDIFGKAQVSMFEMAGLIGKHVK